MSLFPNYNYFISLKKSVVYMPPEFQVPYIENINI